MAGITQSQIKADDPLKVSGYSPEKITLDAGDTVEGRIGQVTSNSMLRNQADTRALQRMNRRGIVNSSMAIQAGEAELYNAALPIASQDAQTSYAAKRANQDAGNTAFQFTADAGNRFDSQRLAGKQNLEQIGAQGEQQRLNIGAQTNAESRLISERGDIEKALQTADAETRERLLGMQGNIDRQLQELRGTQETGLQELRGQQSKELAEIENANRTLLQTSQMAGQLYSTTAEAISQILANPDIPANQKTELVNRQKELLQAGLGVVGGMGNLDLGELLNFGTTAGAGNIVGSGGNAASNTVSIGGKNYDTLVVGETRDLAKEMLEKGNSASIDNFREFMKRTGLKKSDVESIAGDSLKNFWVWRAFI
jgi:hypothetical protein